MSSEEKRVKNQLIEKEETEQSSSEFIFPAVKYRMSQRNSFEWRGSTGFDGCRKSGERREKRRSRASEEKKIRHE